MRAEILAPCGSRESLFAAVRCGANAVYLGLKDFNARKNADNFTYDELKEAVSYCHARNVKVYIALNTLVSDSEMKAACEAAEKALLCGADAFIVQDLGLAGVLKRSFPEIRLHASTQCSVSTPEGFRELERLGFSRAVLPREMSFNEIKEIRKNTAIELEMFVHGALCMCVSGQCYLSSMLGGRSGNRGLCAQPCRLSFSADNSGSFDLSLKDLSLISKLGEIEGAGIASLKIEGRMKRPEYVAAAVTACKKALDKAYSENDESVLKSVFSRTGFTDGYFTGKRNEMFGFRRKDDVIAAGGVLKELSRLYEKETPLVPIDFSFTCVKGAPSRLEAGALGRSAEVKGAVPEAAISKPMTAESVEARLSKLGGTQYFLNSVDITLDEGLILPASELNALRRNAISALEAADLPEIKTAPFSAIHPKEKNAEPYFTARFSNAEQIPKNHSFKRFFLPVWESDEAFIKSGAGVELPRGLFGAEERLINDLKRLKALGVKQALCSNIGAYKVAESLGFEMFGDFGLNIFNSESASLFNSPVLSYELTLRQANSINKDETGIIAYGKLPLMLTRNCPIKNNIGCEKCKKQGTLTDRKGYKFPVKCSSYPCIEILNPVPLVLSDRMNEVKCDFIHFYFTDESKEEIEKTVRLFRNGEPFGKEFTRGLYFRGVK